MHATKHHSLSWTPLCLYLEAPSPDFHHFSLVHSNAGDTSYYQTFDSDRDPHLNQWICAKSLDAYKPPLPSRCRDRDGVIKVSSHVLRQGQYDSHVVLRSGGHGATRRANSVCYNMMLSIAISHFATLNFPATMASSRLLANPYRT